MLLAVQAQCWTSKEVQTAGNQCIFSKNVTRRKEVVSLWMQHQSNCSSLTCLICLRERKTDNLLWATFQLLQSGIRDVSVEHLDSSCPSTTSGWEEGFSSSSEPSQPSDSSFRSSKKRQSGHKNCCSLGMGTALEVPTHAAANWFWLFVGRQSSEHSNWKY